MKSLVHIQLFIMISLAGVVQLFAQGDSCSTMKPFCAGTSQYVFSNSNAANGNAPVAESGPNYKCLKTQTYPAWFYLQIEDSGNLNFRIGQTVNADGSGGTLDVDFVAWGPFNEGDPLCGSSVLNSSKIVGCSYSPSATENFTINNATSGKIYVVLITNYSEKPGFITLEQTNLNQTNSGKTDCSIVNILGEDLALCNNDPVQLTARNVIATKYEYYFFDVGLNKFVLISDQVSPNLTVSETGRYKVIAINEVTNLELDDEILIQYFEKPVATTPKDLTGCSNESTAIFDLSEVYSEITHNSPNPDSSLILNFYDGDTGFANKIEIENPNSYEGNNNRKIIATITNNKSKCISNPVEFQLKISTIPIVEFPEEAVFCLDANGGLNNPQTFGEDLGSQYTYEWNLPNDPDGDGVQNPVLTLTELPAVSEVSLNITNKETGCSNTFSAEINSYLPLKNVGINIAGNDFEDGYAVTANAANSGGNRPEYEYQLDAGPWQMNSVFNNVQPGLHTITARDIYGCSIMTSSAFRLVGYARFFTPNGDGTNDRWNVIDPEVSITKIFIFDRYGKLIKQLDPSGNGWDGTFNGKLMPADDYWFTVVLRDKITGIVSEFTGHFTLKL